MVERDLHFLRHGFGPGRMPLVRSVSSGWTRRAKALLFILVLVLAELPLALYVTGMLLGVPAIWFDPVGMAVALILLVVCDILAVFMTFYVKVTRPPPQLSRRRRIGPS